MPHMTPDGCKLAQITNDRKRISFSGRLQRNISCGIFSTLWKKYFVLSATSIFNLSSANALNLDGSNSFLCRLINI